MNVKGNTFHANPKKLILVVSSLLLLCYLVYGIFFLELPVINADENWEISRMRNLIELHRIDEPMLTKDVSPFYAMYFNATPANQLIGFIKTGAYCLSYLFLPFTENQAVRFATFFWSLLLCLSTYFLAREFKLSKIGSVVSAVALISAPEFLSQIHSQRAEIALAFCSVLFVILLLRAMKVEHEWKRTVYLVLIGFGSWIPAIGIHPTGLFIPPTLGIIFLIVNRKKLFSRNTLIFEMSLLPGFFLFTFIYFSIAAKAHQLGGGNLFDMHGPPVLKGLKYIFKIPWAFYNKFESFNIFSRPLSFLWVLVSGIGMIHIYKVKKNLVQWYPVILPAIIVPLIMMYLLSGSYGHYNIIIFPFLSITIGYLVNELVEKEFSFGIISKTITLSLCMLMLFSSNFYGMNTHKKYVYNYNKLEEEVRQAIPSDVPVLGSALYYTKFEQQPFYHFTYFLPDVGIAGQSFEEGVRLLKVQYLIVDDLFLGEAILSKRPSPWLDNMLNFIHDKCSLQQSFQTKFFVDNRVPDPKLYPESWKYDGMKKDILQKVCVYKINSPEIK